MGSQPVPSYQVAMVPGRPPQLIILLFLNVPIYKGHYGKTVKDHPYRNGQ